MVLHSPPTNKSVNKSVEKTATNIQEESDCKSEKRSIIEFTKTVLTPVMQNMEITQPAARPQMKHNSLGVSSAKPPTTCLENKMQCV